MDGGDAIAYAISRNGPFQLLIADLFRLKSFEPFTRVTIFIPRWFRKHIASSYNILYPFLLSK